MFYFHRIVFVIFLNLILGSNILSQQLNYPLEFSYNQLINECINNSDQLIFSGFKPLLISTLNSKSINDSAFVFPERDAVFSKKFKSRWIYRKSRTEDFVNHESKNFRLQVNPLFHLEYKKKRNGNETAFINTRGIEFKGDISNKFSFYSAFYENQARFESYMNDYIKQNLVVPGQGAAKILPDNKFDFSRASAYISLSLSPNFNIQVGQSKHFIGEGYRSLLLSDNSFNYPFLKLTATFNKFQYTILWSQYQLFSGAYYNYHQRKYSAISYLSWVPKSGFEISLFESIMWPGNTQEKKDNFNLNYFNPLILSRTAIYGLNNEQNSLLGLNFKAKIYSLAQVFGQFALDNLNKDIVSQNNYAFQLGIKHFNLFHNAFVKHSLFVHLEYNYITPYTYSWKESNQSYSHYNQAITHPGGAGLKEKVALINYRFKDFSLLLKGNFMVNSVDSTNANFGSNIFAPNENIAGTMYNIGNKPGQGIKNEMAHIYSELSFLINPTTNMQLFLGFHYRKIVNEFYRNEDIFYSIGIKTNINNYYFDFN